MRRLHAVPSAPRAAPAFSRSSPTAVSTDLACLMENTGCKGTQANADCNLWPWHGAGSWVRDGFACISCLEPASRTRSKLQPPPRQ